MGYMLPSRLTAPEGPLILSSRTTGQAVLFSWCGGEVARPFVDTVPTFVGSIARVKSPYGPGFATTGGADRATYQRGVPLGNLNGGFTIEVLCAITACPSLSGFVSIFGTVHAGRGLIAFSGGLNRNIYFWSASADLASGVDWRIDGLPQHVFITSVGGSGTTMTFYRDGLSIASGTTPGLAAIATSPVQIGDTNVGWNSTPTGTIYKAALYNRGLTAAEIWEKTRNPFGDYEEIRSRRASVGSAAAASAGFPYYQSFIGRGDGIGGSV